jgi:hypothetical protein
LDDILSGKEGLLGQGEWARCIAPFAELYLKARQAGAEPLDQTR